jgi:ABC-type bacteriocin/lantibiotic exporter with double-glycine peptidase domain
MTTVLDILTVLFAAAFVFFIWPPLVLLVVAAALGLTSWKASR